MHQQVKGEPLTLQFIPTLTSMGLNCGHHLLILKNTSLDFTGFSNLVVPDNTQLSGLPW